MRLRISSVGMQLTEEERDEIQTRIRFALTRFGSQVRSVDVRVHFDTWRNSFHCRVQTKLSGDTVLRLESSASELVPAIALSARRAERATDRHFAYQRLAVPA